MDVIQIRGQLRALLPCFGKIIPVVLEQSLLQIAVAQPTGAQAVLKLLRHRRRRHQFEQLDGGIFVRVGFGFLRCPAVHDHAHDFFADGLFVAENFNRVAITLAHFLTVRAGHHGHLAADLRFGNHKRPAVLLVEFDGDIARHFNMLFLVAPDRDHV